MRVEPLGPTTRRGTRFLELSARSLINPPESTGMPFWSLNPYVGCEFGCTYCFARYAHRFVRDRASRRRDGRAGHAAPPRDNPDAPEWRAFERDIYVKRRSDVIAALDRDLRRVRKRNQTSRQTIGIGTATDPYQPAERQYAVTRTVLARLARERGFRIGIVTKSPLVCRDIDLLRSLTERHEVTVHISLISTDARVIRAFEPRSPMPHVRLRALRRLIGAGIDADVMIAPILPGITDSHRALRRLMEAARDAGAEVVRTIPLRVNDGVRAPFFPALEKAYPKLARRYRSAYARAADAPLGYRKALRARVIRLAEELGLSLGELPRDTDAGGEQLPLWSQL